MTRDDPRAPRPPLSVTLDGHPSGDNVTRRWHWSGKAEHDRAWRGWAKYAALAAGPSVPFERAELRIVWLCKTKRRRDLGNIVGACKPLIDGLVDAKVIRDDNDAVLVNISAVVAPASRDGVRLEVTDLT